MRQDYPDSYIILAGDLNISDNELVIRTDMTSIVNQPTRRNSLLDRICVSDSRYSGVEVKSAVKSDKLVFVAYTGVVGQKSTRRVVFVRTRSTHRRSKHMFPRMRVVSDLYRRRQSRRYWRSTGGLLSSVRRVDEHARPLLRGIYSHNHIR